MDVKEEAILGPSIKDHWYYVSKGRALHKILGEKPVNEVLDVGAGSGIFTRQLLESGLVRRGICVDPNYETEHAEVHNGREIEFVRGVDEVTQQLILMMDVLEHVDDEIGLLRQYTDQMPPNGRVLITVPAFQMLWSGHDEFLEHRRRYTLPQVERLLRRANLRVLRGRYFFGALFPLAAAIRLWDQSLFRAGKIEAKSQLRPMSSFFNNILIYIHDIERETLLPINRLAGLTIFCLASRV